MSGLLDKAKQAVGKATSSESGAKKLDSYTEKGVDQVTDRVGLGDKYDKKISDQADKQIQGQLHGSSNTSGGHTGPK